MPHGQAFAGLSIAVLGPLRVERDGEPVALGGPQQRAVLATLVIHHPEPRTVHQIADDLWNGQPRAGYATTIQSYVHRLRQALEPARTTGEGTPRRLITRGPGGYGLQFADLDLDRYRRTVEAARSARAVGDHRRAHAESERAGRIWRGDPLADLADYPFVVPWAQRLRDERLTAVEADIESRLALGEAAEVVGDLDALIGAHPLRERLHALRMLALYRCGRQADALAGYRALYATLGTELGVEPAPDVRELHRAILAQDPGLGAPVNTAPFPAAQPRPHPTPVLDSNGRAADSRRPDEHGSSPRWPVRLSRGRLRRRWRGLLAAGGAVAVMATGVAAGVIGTGDHARRAASFTALPANAVGLVATDGSVIPGPELGPDPAAIAVGGGSVWVALSASGYVLRIDPRSRQVTDRIPVGRGPAALAYAGDALWVADSGDGTVAQVDPTSGQVVRTVRVGALPLALAAGPSGVWVADAEANAVQQIDPETGAVGPPIDVGGRPSGILVTATSVWVANAGDATLTQLDPTTGQALSGAVAVGSAPGAMALSGTQLWVADADEGAVDRVDTRTAQVTGHLRIGDGPVGLAVVGSQLWVANRYDGRLTLLDSDTMVIRTTVSSGVSPRAIAVVNDLLWVASGPLRAAAHLGGTLTVVTASFVPGDVVGLDPAVMFRRSDMLRALRLVYDGLVAYRAGGGDAGTTLVPDLAEAIPRPIDGGRTWAFTVRAGVRFSDGTPVRPSDIARGVRRALTVAPDNPLQESGLLGAQGCGQSHPVCDLSHAMFVDDVQRRIVFHLAAPDPNFLYRLVYAAQATPADAPAAQAPTNAPIAGTGPYRIARYVEGAELLLVRQPWFRQWSYAAQPAGYPDQIRWLARSTSEAVVDVLAGRVDVLRLRSTEPGVTDIADRHPAQVVSQPLFGLQWLYLNSAVAPFDDVRARQALNLAVDRRTIVSIMGGLDEPACQTLPPNFPGYRPDCPYSTSAPTEAYAGPDLVAARRLVVAAHTTDTPITFVVRKNAAPARLWSYLAEVLQSLGYPVTVIAMEDSDYFHQLRGPGPVVTATGDAPVPWQVMYGPGWLADFPAASDFYFPLYACDAPLAPPSHYCDPTIDAVARRAAAAEGTDPAASRDLWQQVDRALTDQAAIVPLTASSEVNLVSTRVHNLISTTFTGPLFDQIWVQ